MPPTSADNKGHGEEGTASVELIATVPFLLLALACAAQIALAGQSLWSASVAARVGARAALVGADPEEAARRVLPSALRAGAQVEEGEEDGDGDGVISVEVPVLALLPQLPEVKIGARSGLEAGDG